MEYFSRTMFFAFLSELFFAVLAAAVRHDRNKMFQILVVGTLLSGSVGFSPQILSFLRHAETASTTPETLVLHNRPELPEATVVPTHLQVVTEVPTGRLLINHDLSPETFMKSYFDTINKKDYEAAYSMLSDAFRANQSFDEYVSFWGVEIEKVEVLSIAIKSQDSSQALVYVEARYYRKAYVATGHTTYKLIKDGKSWLIDPN